jgi:hypothetical protein
MKPPESENGGPVSETAARVEKPAKVPDVLARLSNKLRLAATLASEAKDNPLRLQQLETWIARLRRELA